MIERVEPFVPGIMISAGKLNQMLEAAQGTFRSSADVVDIDGVHTATPVQTVFAAKITKRLTLVSGDVPKYEWIRAVPRDAEDSGDSWQDAGHLGYGLEDNLPATEDTYLTEVPVDGSAVVEMSLHEGGVLTSFRWDSAPEIWAEITEVGVDPYEGQYAWREVTRSGSAGFAVRPGGFTGTTTLHPLKEKNGETTVPVGYIARAVRGHCTGYPHVEITTSQLPDLFTGTPLKHRIRIRNSFGGTFSLTVHGGTAGGLDYNIGAASLQSAWNTAANGLYTVAVTGTGTDDDPFIVTYSDPLPHLFPVPDNTQLVSDQEWLFEYPGDTSPNTAFVQYLSRTKDATYRNLYKARYYVRNADADGDVEWLPHAAWADMANAYIPYTDKLYIGLQVDNKKLVNSKPVYHTEGTCCDEEDANYSYRTCPPGYCWHPVLKICVCCSEDCCGDLKGCWDEDLQQCLPPEDCCEDGYIWDAEAEECVPVVSGCSGTSLSFVPPINLVLKANGVAVAGGLTGGNPYTSADAWDWGGCMFPTPVNFEMTCSGDGPPTMTMTPSSTTVCQPNVTLELVSTSPFRVVGWLTFSEYADSYECPCLGTTISLELTPP